MIRLRTVIAILIALLCSSAVIACPTCKDGIGNNGNLVNGYGWSIIFMMSMPFIIFFSLGGYFFYEIRKAEKLSIDRMLSHGSNDAQPT